jgi:hypothetical protein
VVIVVVGSQSSFKTVGFDSELLGNSVGSKDQKRKIDPLAASDSFPCWEHIEVEPGFLVASGLVRGHEPFGFGRYW